MNRSLVYIELPDGSQILGNRFNCRDPQKLKELEKLFVIPYIQKAKLLSGNFDFEHLCRIHKTIFGDLYPYWAGKPREWSSFKGQKALGGYSVHYTEPHLIKENFNMAVEQLKSLDFSKMTIDEKAENIADSWEYIWQVHSFADGNTRTTATFMEAFLKSRHVQIDFEYLNSIPGAFRDSLCLYSTFNSRLQKPLISFIKNALLDDPLKRTKVKIPTLSDDLEL